MSRPLQGKLTLVLPIFIWNCPTDPFVIFRYSYMKAFYKQSILEKSQIPPPNYHTPKAQEFSFQRTSFTNKSPSFTPWITNLNFEIRSSRKSTIERHEEQIQGIQCYLEEIPPERFEHIENDIEGLGSNHKISLARYRIAELAEVINDMETRHQADIENLMNSIIELQNRME
ncbi:hypothetical protein Tco_0618534 [Tanacetum coccineum]